MSVEGRLSGLTRSFGQEQNSLGASAPSGPGTVVALAPGESYTMRCRITDPSKYTLGMVVRAEIAYFDITERLHQSIFTITGARPLDQPRDKSVPLELAVRNAFVHETDRELPPAFRSPQAVAREQHEQRRLRARAKRWWDRIRAKLKTDKTA